MLLGLVGVIVIVAIVSFSKSSHGLPPHKQKGGAARILVLAPPTPGSSSSTHEAVVRKAPAASTSPYVLGRLPPPSGHRVLPVPVGARSDFVSPSLTLPSPPTGWYLEVGATASYRRAHRLLERFTRSHFQAWISPRATASGAERYRVWIGPYADRGRVEAVMLNVTALTGVAPRILRHHHGG